jgi:uncharacterized protein YceK
MTRISATSALLGALLLAVGLTLAGCGTTGAHAAASPSPSVGDAQILAIGRQYSQCLRDHGVAGFPDPTMPDGQMGWPIAPDGQEPKQMVQDNPQAEQACRTILDQLPASAQRGQAVTAADLQKLRQFAQCLRQNGIPDWPDPKSDGSFRLVGTPLAAEGKSPRIVAAMQACQQYWDKGINFS